MQILKSKTIASIIAIILISSMAISMIPMVSAYNNATQATIDKGMKWDLRTLTAATMTFNI